LSASLLPLAIAASASSAISFQTTRSPTSTLSPNKSRSTILRPRGGGGGTTIVAKAAAASTIETPPPASPSSSSSPPPKREWWVESPDLDKVLDAPLLSDIEMLSNMLAEVVKRENPAVYDLYTTFRKHGMNRAALTGDDESDVADSKASFEAMRTLARDISPRGARGVMKTFGIALNLVNAAEVHHRMRLVRTMNNNDGGGSSPSLGNVGPLPMVEDSICGTMEILLRGDESSQAVDPQRIFDRLMTQKCEIVLTAHPTEVNRKTLIRKCELHVV
jgi:hypothetical protein